MPKNKQLKGVFAPIPEADETFFAGANTGNGFQSFYPDIFDEKNLERLYIIKGGPGSGKSTLMRRFLARGREASLHTQAYLCGSDPASLDAAIVSVNGRACGMIDATSPHPYDARYPGCASEIFDCGRFWDSDVLRAHREAIVSLGDAKAAAYRRAYGYLGALGRVRREERRLVSEALDVDKMFAACRRFVRTLTSGGKSVSRCASAISMRGEGELELFPDFGLVAVTDSASSATFFMEAMRRALCEAGIGNILLADHLEPDQLCGIVIPGDRLIVKRIRSTEQVAVKNFNMMRFLRRDILSSTRNKRSLAAKCGEGLTDGALSCFAEAGMCHFALEDIYVSAMDFDSLAKAGEELISGALALVLGK